MMTFEKFLSEVADHEMTIMHEAGINRHIRFQKPGHSNLWFELVTWPGCLAIHGDMGSWMFNRVTDMFEFFRGEKINPSYWAEKIVSESRFGGPCQKFNVNYFRECIHSILEDYDLPSEKLSKIKEQLEEDVLCFSDDGEVDAHHALSKFNCDGFEFSDAWEIKGRDWTYHFIWCLYAIVWGIQQYDAEKEKALKGLCRYCDEGNPRVQSSVSEQFVHTDTPVGRVVCKRP